jgi:hypothetical protein
VMSLGYTCCRVQIRIQVFWLLVKGSWSTWAGLMVLCGLSQSLGEKGTPDMESLFTLLSFKFSAIVPECISFIPHCDHHCPLSHFLFYES